MLKKERTIFLLVVLLGGSSLADARPGQGEVSFIARRDFGVGGRPAAVALGDFNEDKIPDLVTAIQSNQVSVLLGQGNGLFGAPTNFTVGRGPVSIAVEDFNGDGHMDLAVANSTSNNLSLLFGRGDGTFDAAINLPVGQYPASIQAADFNGDGHPDLAVANLESDRISILLGRGDGTFEAMKDLEVPKGPTSLAVGDFNGDDHMDLATANIGTCGEVGTTVSVLLGNGDGTFGTAQNYSVAKGPNSIAVGDFNRDGRPDLAVSSIGECYGVVGALSILHGRGDGTFGAAETFAVAGRPRSITVGDFDADGRPDVALAVADNVSVLFGNGEGTFGPIQNLEVGMDPTSVVVGDFNGDGHTDLAVANWTAQDVSIILGNGDGTFRSAPSFEIGGLPVAVLVKDFNGDGHPDLAVVHYRAAPDPNTVSILLGDGRGEFRPAGSFAIGSFPTGGLAEDFNGDGILDLAVTHASGTVPILQGNGNGTFRTRQIFEAEWGVYSIATGDFNGDAIPDLAVTSERNCCPTPLGIVSILLGNGDGTFQAPQSFEVGHSPRSVAVGDFNSDGRLDLVVANWAFESRSLSVLLGHGDGTFEPAENYPLMSYPTDVIVGDFNQDGKLDLATNTGAILFGNGDGTFQPAQNLAAAGGAITAGDFNGDDLPDLAVVREGARQVLIQLGNGDGTFQPPQAFGAGRGPARIAIGDLNGDHRQDLVIANRDARGVSILINDTRNTAIK